MNRLEGSSSRSGRGRSGIQMVGCEEEEEEAAARVLVERLLIGEWQCEESRIFLSTL